MNWLLDPIAKVLGFILNYIDKIVYFIGSTHNTGICIIVFTFVVNGLMFPLTMKQQKTAKLSSIMNPEIQSIQAKYKGKKDNASMQKMQLETQAVYDRYGISPFGGCLPLLIQMPIMFALYRVVYQIPTFAPALKDATNFLGLNLSKSPDNPLTGVFTWTLIIPLLAVVTQFVSTKLMSAGNNKNANTKSSEPSAADSMKMMNNIMPLVSGVFCFSFPMGVGLYWITGNLFRIVQALLVNYHFSKMDMDTIIEKNKDKAAKKATKREVMNDRVSQYSTQKTTNIKTNAKGDNVSSKDLNINKDVQPGSVSGYAKMLSGKRDNEK